MSDLMAHNPEWCALSGSVANSGGNLFEHLNPTSWEDAVNMEAGLAGYCSRSRIRNHHTHCCHVNWPTFK
jgi:hypothetical protein